jgi:EAL domain-containing protein (putative c-di-GMP-specific phosphodiesterase class I)
VFVAVINKTNEEVEGRYNAFVDDLERVVNEVYAMQTKVDEADKAIREEAVKLNKSVADLEAHINTSVITEKSVRKAQDQQLAEEIDNLAKKIGVMASNLDFQISRGGENTLSNQQALLQDVANNKRDIDKFGADLGQMLLEFNQFRERAVKNLIDQASAI